MWQSVQESYIESRILTASPIELVAMLYDAAIAAVRDARRKLAAGDIAARSRAITKACEILIELTQGLDHARGGEISLRLAQLYDYIQHRLIEANIQQNDAPLADALGLLSTLAEAWHTLRDREVQTKAAAPAPAWVASQTAEPVLAGRDWSL
jgi:flagellar secretion chaperone FliS